MGEISTHSTHVDHGQELTLSSQEFGVEATLLSTAVPRC